ncbi:MAG: M23 family metallopeptidase [Sedimentisphaerales bacterium]|nr:M23 family metallopeptidase [Sedimentisphaerales bacterium]
MKYLLIMLIALLGAAALYFKDQVLLSPHDSYYSALLRENLKATAERWKREAEESLAAPLPITLPYSERRLLEADYLQPITFAVDRKMDELIQITILPSINTRAEVFVDVFYVKDAATEPMRIGSMATKEQQLTIAAEHTGKYLVRLQPSHSAQGLMDITITSPLRYGFPVDTVRENAVQSLFGVGRDGGARRHEGIDIFAPRGTPVIAAETGLVTRVGDTPRGGKNVWVRGDQRSFYYAHLDSIAVSAGDSVRRGETLGTVGNTGNAITTSPHLHFGIYKFAQGAVDPLPMVGRKKSVTPYAPPRVEPASRWLSINTEKANLRSGPSLKTTTVTSLMRAELLQVDSVAGDWLRVTTGNGTKGFIARRLTETPSDWMLTLTENYVAFSLPDDTAPVVGNFSAGDKLPTLGRFGSFAWVKMPGGVYAWAKVVKQETPTPD